MDSIVMYNIHIKPTIDAKIKLIMAYNFRGTIVPKNFESDGLTIPWLFRLAVNKFSPKYLPCAIVHDYLCDKEEYVKADDIFEEMLTIADGGQLSFRANIMVWSVRLYHYLRYGES